VTAPIIVALDVRTAEEALRLATRLKPHVAGFQIGLGVLHGPGPGVVGALARVGPVLADAKLHDIPSQVRAAARRLGEYGARWITVHASGGQRMLEAAREGLAEGAAGRDTGVLAITVLTSLDAIDLTAVGLGDRPGRLVSKMARVADAAGIEGVVCSPQEIRVVAEVAPRLLTVIPGIRPDGEAAADQRRVATPEEAIVRGADLLVIGRPIVDAPDPEAAAEAIGVTIRAVAAE